MEIKEIEHVYTITGTEQEARDLQRELNVKLNEVTIYSTPFDHRIVCKEMILMEDLCPFYNETIMPDEYNLCSLCGEHKA